MQVNIKPSKFSLFPELSNLLEHDMFFQCLYESRLLLSAPDLNTSDRSEVVVPLSIYKFAIQPLNHRD